MNYIGLYTLVKQEVQRFMRIVVQTLVTPWISSVLYIFVFGSILGSRIDTIEGIRYINFVLPGVLMMNVLSGAFAQSSSSIYFQRFTKNIEERLVAPLSYAEMVIGYLVGATVRAVVIGIGIMLIGVAFNAASMYNFPLFLFYIVGVSIIFGLIGLLVGLWANNFEQLTILNTFVIMPLSFIGGMFNSVKMLPSYLQLIAYFNPFLYFNDGIRYSMTGYHETNIMAGIMMIIILAIVLFILIWRLFSIGWKLRI
jgi:ABC-2 type transport system permease protein